MGLYVQYGCGLTCPDGWLNFDASPTLRLERLPAIGSLVRRGAVRFPANVRYGDIVKGLPVADNSADGVFASHVLEHLALDEFGIALANTFRMLKPGGAFRLVVPDLEARARKYLAMAERKDGDAAAWLMRATLLGAERRPHGLVARLRALFGHSAHLWMWDEPSLAAALGQAGFTEIRRCSFNDSADPAFRPVEARERFGDTVLGLEECAMEARKPFGRRPDQN